MIYKTKSLIVAESVLLQLTDILNCPDSDPKYGKVGSVLQECYQNGREQGFVVWPLFDSDKAFFVAQCRGGDSIVVHYGRYAMQSVSEDAYRNSHYFDEHAHRKAAAWIADELVKLWEAEEAMRKDFEARKAAEALA